MDLHRTTFVYDPAFYLIENLSVIEKLRSLSESKLLRRIFVYGFYRHVTSVLI